MKKIMLQKIVRPFGLVGETKVYPLQGVKFDNGKIAYLDSDQIVKTLDSVDALKDQPNLKIVEKDA